MSEENGACHVVRTLLRGGVDTMFANPGTTEMLVVDALDKVAVDGKTMRSVLCLHETVCSGAADGYGRMTGSPACTLLHLGVGLANATANLHNARRACTPVVNLVGDMATWHVDSDPLLASDIDSLASFSSRSVLRAETAGDAARTTVEALLAVRDYRCGESRVATLALPHDVQRDAAVLDDEESKKVSLLLESCRTSASDAEPSLFEQSIAVHNERFGGNDAIPKHVSMCATALRKSKSALLVSGTGLSDEKALAALSDVQRETGCSVVVENAFARVERGEGRPDWIRAPYFPSDAQKFFSKFESIVLCGARAPVAMFGYEDGVSKLLPEQGVLEIDAMDVPGAICFLRDKVLGDATHNEKKSSPRKSPAAASCSGRLNAGKLCQILAKTQPARAIVVDESLTSGTAYWDCSKHCPPFSHLTLTGGSIGIGLPLAVGCAVACPDRRVIAFQADGSGLYSTPALWTMAAEGLNVTVVVCANKTYQILKVEQQKQRLPTASPNAKKLTSIGNVDWVSIAKGYGIEAVAVTAVEQLEKALVTSFQTDGPFLIEANL